MVGKRYASKKAIKRTIITENTERSAGPSPGGISRIWAFLDNLAASRRVLGVCAFLLPISVIAYYPSSEALRNDYDIWFHLAYGKHYVQNLTWYMDHSMYSWTPAIGDWMYVTWLGSSIIYLVHLILGVPGLFALRMLLLLASGAVVIRFAKAAGTRLGLSLLAGLLLVAVTIRIGAQYVKPEMFSIFMLTLLIAFYLRFRMAPKQWIIAVFPILFLLWINTHGLWIFGLGFIGLVLTVDLVLYIVRRDQALDRKALIYLSYAVGITFIALCVNPHGPIYPIQTVWDKIISPWPSIFFAATSNGDLVHYREVAAYQSMWEHLFFPEKQYRFYLVSAWSMIFMIFSLLWVWRVSWKRSGMADFPVVAANIVFFFMGMFIGRLLLIFPLSWIFSIIFFARHAGPGPMFSRTGPLFLFVFLVLTVYTAFVAISVYAAPSWFGAQYRDYMPDREVRYIMENNLPGPLFNDYLSGGYLVWAMFPAYEVFVDSRHFPYRDHVFPDYTGIGTKFPLDEKGFRSFMEKYPARIALINYAEPNLILWFQRIPEWTLAYFDKIAVVMIHRDVIPTLTPEARAAMRSPENYKDVSDPIVLSNLFNIYKTFLGARYAEQILDIYDQNVSNLFWLKDADLAEMKRFLDESRKMEGRNLNEYKTKKYH